jgi:D-aminoacyl-tRNA deacylase
LFIEIGTTEKQWTNTKLCDSVAQIVVDVMNNEQKISPVALCFGGTHYPEKFTQELINGKYALGTVIPKHALEFLDEDLFSHVLKRNYMAKTALLDWGSLGKYKQKVLQLVETTDLEAIKL